MQVLGLDVGGSGIKGALVDTQAGTMLTERHRISTPHPATPAAVVETAAQIVTHFGWDGPVGCGFPAVVKEGMVRTASNIDAEWVGLPGQRMFAEATGCPVWLLNDADAAGTAEVAFGAGQGQRGLVLVITLGTGIGTAVFSDGHLLPNTELGHIELHGKDAETYASDGVRKKKDLKWNEWAVRLDEYLHAITRLLWPDLIIIGGGVSKKHEKFLPLLTVKSRIVPAMLRNEAGIIGAALVARRTFEAEANRG